MNGEFNGKFIKLFSISDLGGEGFSQIQFSTHVGYQFKINRLDLTNFLMIAFCYRKKNDYLSGISV